RDGCATSSRSRIRISTRFGSACATDPASQAPRPFVTVTSSPARTRRTLAAWCASAPESTIASPGCSRPTDSSTTCRRTLRPEPVAELREQSLLVLAKLRIRRLRALREFLDELTRLVVDLRGGHDLHGDAQIAPTLRAQTGDAAVVDLEHVAGLHARADLEI